MHRRENLGEPMKAACRAIKRLAENFPQNNFLFPVHLNPAVREIILPLLSGFENIKLLEPLHYSDFANLMARMHFIITDSGGLQEEGPSLGKPVLVLRNKTERPVAVKFGTVKLTGMHEKKIFFYANKLFTDKDLYSSMAKTHNPYGDGKAASRTVFAIKNYFSIKTKPLAEFVPEP
jgi:UDP-N-acetylglucosamine 2-epimerase (non-hydrolysing)